MPIAAVAKLVDALRSGRSEGDLMEVQVFSAAQKELVIGRYNSLGDCYTTLQVRMPQGVEFQALSPAQLTNS